jgi:hypothetical protein
MAGTTGLEPATSAVTGQRSNQLSYVPTLRFSNMDMLRRMRDLQFCCLLSSTIMRTVPSSSLWQDQMNFKMSYATTDTSLSEDERFGV